MRPLDATPRGETPASDATRATCGGIRSGVAPTAAGEKSLKIVSATLLLPSVPMLESFTSVDCQLLENFDVELVKKVRQASLIWSACACVGMVASAATLPM